MNEKERILVEIQGIIDDLKEANHWHEVDRLADHLQTIKDDLEEL